MTRPTLNKSTVIIIICIKETAWFVPFADMLTPRAELYRSRRQLAVGR